MKQALRYPKEKKSGNHFFLVFMTTLFLVLTAVFGCGTSGEDYLSEPASDDAPDDSTPVIPEGCRQYPQRFGNYQYEWNNDQNAIIGYSIRGNCLARTRIYMNKSDFIDEGEVFGLDLSLEYDDIDCADGGPGFLTTNTFDGSKLMETSYKVDDLDVELFVYTWEAHDQNNRPIIGSRKVLFDQGRTSLEVMCDHQLIRRTYYDEKNMILEERFLADNIYPIEDENNYRAEGFQERECAESRATQTYYTEYGLIHVIKWFTTEDIDPDVEVPPPPEPDDVFEVCVEK